MKTPKELQKIVSNNEKAAEIFAPDEKPVTKFINAIKLIETQENLTEFTEMYKDAIMKLPAEQYQSVANELTLAEQKLDIIE